MAVKIRLTRLGDKKTPFYRIVVADSRVGRDAKYIDLIGSYNPLTNPEEIKIDTEKAQTWIKNGAQPTETVKVLLKKVGLTEEKKATEKKAKKTSATGSKKTTASEGKKATKKDE